ncbi:MAG: DUF4328 domain-containing protein [Hyphomonadaceae bacterium]|nr:DUF4328 domain-containing protein [Hyphomonadaceae bacterium]
MTKDSETSVYGAPRDPTLLWRLMQFGILTMLFFCALSVATRVLEIVIWTSENDLSLAGAILAYSSAAVSWVTALALPFSLLILLWLTARLTRNLHTLSPTRIAVTPMEAIGWHFAPIANLYMPMRITGMIRRRTLMLARSNEGSRWLVGWWWLLWLLSGLVVIIAQSTASEAYTKDSGDMYESAVQIDIVGSILSVIAYALMWRVFAPIVVAQKQLIGARNAPPVSGEAPQI